MSASPALDEASRAGNLVEREVEAKSTTDATVVTRWRSPEALDSFLSQHMDPKDIFSDDASSDLELGEPKIVIDGRPR